MKGLDLIDRVPDELWIEVCDIVQETGIKNIPKRKEWLYLLTVQGTLKSLLQYHSSKASVLQCSAFFIVQLSHPYITTGKTIALSRWTFVGKAITRLNLSPL